VHRHLGTRNFCVRTGEPRSATFVSRYRRSCWTGAGGERARPPGRNFIQSHLEVLAGADFFTVAVLTWRGLVTYYVLFFNGPRI
jgi:hypothetical protein